MKLTILMYHKIDELPAGVRNPGNFVSPRRFEEQMDAVLSWGYRTISFEQWLDYRNGVAVTLPSRPLIVTFDDGYTCFDDHAWPVLRARDNERDGVPRREPDRRSERLGRRRGATAAHECRSHSRAAARGRAVRFAQRHPPPARAHSRRRRLSRARAVAVDA